LEKSGSTRAQRATRTFLIRVAGRISHLMFRAWFSNLTDTVTTPAPRRLFVIRKDAIYTASGYSVIRIPYFVQFDAAVVDFLFKGFANDLSAYNSFSHGFHDAKAVLPADFCELGVERFKSDLERFDIVAVDIIESLRKKSYEIGNPLCVVPRSMMHFL
jgi:hypothetical protein